MLVFNLAIIFPLVLLVICIPGVISARASFNVHFPWMTRANYPTVRAGLHRYDPFCGDIVHNPQPYSGYSPTFVSFSGNTGDLVSVRYTRTRVPRTVSDFPYLIAKDIPISPSGQLCFDIQMPLPKTNPEYGVMLFEARDPGNQELISFYCSDVKLVDEVVLASEHPAMCAANNETLIPMPDEFL